ncbi:MAG: hypothetical protein E3J47_08235 [Candidatus Stahlbacteria bacterium]|nr:MAG: hypothetical protein E3J47_08235 [Candidatus Stahlbacteria bacterium]
MKDLKDCYLYKIDARNSNYGIWIEKRVSFIISRTKFSDNFLFEEEYADGSDFGTALPLEEIEKSPFTNEDMYGFMRYKKEQEILDYLNNQPGYKGRV